MKRILLASTLALLGFVVTACAGDKKDTSTPGTGATANPCAPKNPCAGGANPCTPPAAPQR